MAQGNGQAGGVAFRLEGHVLSAMGLHDVPAPEGSDFAMAMPLTPSVVNTRGGLQGGFVATLVDLAAARAVAADLADDESAATADLNIRYLSSVNVGPAVAAARVLRRGRTLTVVEVTVRDEGRDVVAAVATLSFSVVALRPGQPHAKDLSRDT
ncbi:PaaI family thioesterase [Actinocorallia aurea]